jgi:hypothetical protein
LDDRPGGELLPEICDAARSRVGQTDFHGELAALFFRQTDDLTHDDAIRAACERVELLDQRFDRGRALVGIALEPAMNDPRQLAGHPGRSRL